MRTLFTTGVLATLLLLLVACMPGAAWAEYEGDDSCIKSVSPMALDLPYTAGVTALDVTTYNTSCTYTLSYYVPWLYIDNSAR